MLRPILITCALTSVVLLGVLIDRQSHTPAVRPEGLPEQEGIFAPGRVEGASLEIELRPQLAGRIAQINVREGQLVRRDQVLLQLDDAEYRQQVALAAAKLKLAKARLDHLVNGARAEQRTEAAALLRAKQAELERAELTWNRVQELRQSQTVSQQEADNQRTLVAALKAEVEAAKARHELIEAPAREDEVAMAQARIDAARAQLGLAQVQLDRTRLCAPCDGQILDLDAAPGELTGPDAPEPTIVMANLAKCRVRAFVEEFDAPRVTLGMNALITADGLPGQEFHGRVVHLSPRMTHKELLTHDPTERYDTKTREVWIELDEPDKLVVGLRVDALLLPAASSDVVAD
ncbi:MAG: efflux RND transporter periplasmic adaptor subunit [Pirellulales bacterium]|nr:efflux RND transporter periplasmic adaptor subunit [Pirellulales bacterium]